MGSKNHSIDHKKAYLAVWLALLALTFITVEVSYHDFGVWNIAVAMGVATIKGSLVCLYFMHLRYDNRVNQVVFVSAFVFLAIFLGLTASDEFYRPVTAEVKVHEVKEPEGNQAAKMKELLQSTPELVARGQGVYQANCVACHGASGQGDGPAASALSPKPRNFTSAEGWKNGRAPAQIFKTLNEGIPGSSMASFSTLSIEDRWALVHYIESITPNPPPDTPQTLAAIGITETTAPSTEAARPSVELPIPFAIDRLVEEAQKK